MDFSLDIGELTATIREYGNTIKDLEEQKENINKAIKELTDQGWSGEAKDKFMENHIKKQEFYTNLIEKMKYTKNALESQEKPRAIQLKKRSENFEACIKRSGGGVALTNDDSGIISLQYGGQFPINNNIDECTNDYYRNMNSKFVEILSLVNSLSFTTFPIAGDVLNLQNSLRNQTESLTDFKASFNEYCNGVRDMEDNICSVFSKISGITEGISHIRGMSIISENGQVDKNKVIELMLKDPGKLTTEEKQMLEYAKIVLGEDECKKLLDSVQGPTLEEAAELADHIYFTKTVEEAKKDELLGGWKLDYVKEPDPGKYSVKIGVYKRIKPNGEVEYALVNRGSRDFVKYWKKDWKNNAQQVVGASDDMKLSIKFADQFVQGHPDANITFVGHSKGGAEAAANAIKTNQNCIVFNPAAVNIKANGLSKEKAGYKGNMTSYIVKGEVINDFDSKIVKPIDKAVYLPEQYHNRDYNPGHMWDNAVANHLMPAVKASINEEEQKEQGKGEN
ncbi:DUF2974 domain-containing protein [Clostridium sp. P21]|uniref:DUF2974 domain-containing protein n=1 Tax=Clostridium muellerianum TaxID=2716538 RepID=A0A7Y0EII1_9CLOT|nr:DUF2974 domain-containing protein [Clostridium muellerianum]NMM64106.1 DUF2974 domain-containing protein [Clostridium muellerianum]